MSPPHPNPFLKIQWEIHFGNFFVMIKMLEKFKRETWTFSFQICFCNQFQTSESDQTEITPFTPIGPIWSLVLTLKSLVLSHKSLVLSSSTLDQNFEFIVLSAQSKVLKKYKHLKGISIYGGAHSKSPC